jgi:hypothetical protein
LLKAGQQDTAKEAKSVGVSSPTSSVAVTRDLQAAPENQISLCNEMSCLPFCHGQIAKDKAPEAHAVYTRVSMHHRDVLIF